MVEHPRVAAVRKQHETFAAQPQQGELEPGQRGLPQQAAVEEVVEDVVAAQGPGHEDEGQQRVPDAARERVVALIDADDVIEVLALDDG